MRWQVGWVLVASLLAVAPLSGCATHLPAGDLPVDYRGGEGRVVRVVSPFVDVRAHKECLGDETIFSASSPQQLRCSSNPPEQLAERLAKELQRAGYTVLGVDEPGSADVLELRGTLQSLDVEAVEPNGYREVIEADVWIWLHASTPSGLSASRSFYVKESASEYGCWDFCELIPGELLDRSATRAVREMTAAVLSLTNRYPVAPIASVAAPATPASEPQVQPTPSSAPAETPAP